jgi:chaperonin GroEL
VSTVINVGAATETEMKEKKARVEDALHATRAAVIVKAGVIDPTKVTRYALQNAASISGLMLTTEALVAEMIEKEKPASGRTDYQAT